MLNEITTSSSRFWIEDGILKSRPLRPTTYGRKEVLESIEAMVELAAGRALPRLAFMDGVMYADRDARELYVKDERSLAVIEAMALVGESYDGQFISSFAAKVTEAPFPVAVFQDEPSAIAWLRETCSDPQGS